MAASPSLERTHHAPPWSTTSHDADPSALVVRAVGTATAGSAAVCGLVIAMRRLAGVVEPAGPALLLGAAAAGVPLLVAADAARRSGAALAVPLLARAGVATMMVALGFPPRAAGLGGWLAVAAAFAVTAAVCLRMPARSAVVRAPRTNRTAETRRRGDAPQHAGRASRRKPQPGQLRQRFERRELAAGSERVRGRLVIAVPAGARTSYGHLGFCPAFTTTPTVDLTTAYDGVEATVSAAEVLPWGVRVECRLAEPAEEPLEIPVDLVAFVAAP